MNPFKTKEKEKIEEKKDLQKIIGDRLKEYQLAIDYFKENELNTQLKKCEEDIKTLNESLEKIKSGKKDEINEKNLPKEITPEYINGYSNEERIKKYFEIIIKIISEKQKLQTELENEIKALKKLNKNEILSMKEDIQSDFEKIKKKKIKYDEIINILKEDFQNKWIPAPLYSETEEDTKIEKINDDVPENTIRIEFKDTDYKKSNRIVFLIAKLVDTSYEETWDQKDVGNWEHIIEWNLDKDEYEKISEKKFHFEVYERLKNRNKFKGDGDIDLSKLKNEITLKDYFKFNLQTKRIEPHVNIIFKIRNCYEPTFDIFKKRIFCFTKFYPAFKEES